MTVERRPRYAIIGSRGYPSTYGGFETLVRRLAPYLVQRGADVTVYGRERRLVPDRHRVDGVTVVNTPGISSTSLSTLSYGATSSVHAAASRFDAALVLNVANGYFLPILRKFGVPSAVNVDGIEWERDKWSSLGKRVFKHSAEVTARHADTLIADSREISRRWKQDFSVPSTFIPYGGDVVARDDTPSVEHLGLADDGYVLVVARLVPENNVDLLLDAMELLQFKYPTVVVGSGKGSGIEDRLRKVQEEQDQLTWLGHVSDQELLGALWSRAGVYVHGHSVGGTNPALVQALGFGAPTLAFGTAYNREVLGDDGSVYPHDAHALADKIDTLMQDQARRSELRRAGQQTVKTRYSWEMVLDGYAQVLESLAASTDTARRGAGATEPLAS